MQKKYITLAVNVWLLALSSPLYAEPFDKSGITTMVYINLPFGGVSSKQEAPILGFSINHALPEQRDGFSYHTTQFQQPMVSEVRSLVDVRFNTQKENWSRFNIGGMDVLTYKVRLNADGTTGNDVAGISTGTIGAIGAVAIGVMVIGLAVAVNHETENAINTVTNAIINTPIVINKP